MFKNFNELLNKAKECKTSKIAVAQANDVEVLKALKIGEELGLIYPILIGNKREIEKKIKKVGLKKYEIVSVNNINETAIEAVKTVSDGEAQILMKGLINTSVFIRAILNKDFNLRTDRHLSLLAVYEISNYHKLLYCTDSGVNVNPNLEQKKEILINALLALSSLGIQSPNVAVLSSNENVDPKIQSTIDAKSLVEMVENQEIPNCNIEGPIAFDVAFNKNAANHKKINSQISGDVDLLLFPNIETGNVLGKSWLYFNKAKWGGIILGASNPIVLGSRSDNAEIKINSIALACLASNKIS